MGTGDVSLACAAAFVQALVDGGARHASLSPGSRSTPLAMALDAHPDVTVHVHLDERAAGFFALGLAKASGEPVAVACTSGTAAAELFPAVVEASQTRVPLLVMTADRPPRLRGTGANQTIDQSHLFGSYVRWFVDAPVPAVASDVSAWATLGIRALHAADGDPRGPVHANLPFDEPLMPEDAAGRVQGSPLQTSEKHVDAEIRLRLVRHPPMRADAARAADELSGAHGVMVAGSMPESPLAVLELAERLGWPVLAEPTSGLRLPGRTLAAGQALLSCAEWIEDHRPDIVLQLGAAPTTRATQAFVASAERLVVVDDHHLDPDPEGRAWWRLHADPEALASMLVASELRSTPAGWLTAWRAADGIARSALDVLLDSWDEPFEGRVARDLAGAIPDGARLVVGSSMPIRDLDAFMAPREGLRVIANRGASGIDGLVSTTLGVAASGGATYALLGDLSLLHDAGSLLWSASRGYDAVLVVPNNDGGGVFSFLPQAALPQFERLFATPHGLDLAAVAAAGRAGYERVKSAADLVPAIERGAVAGGVQVVEVPSDRVANVTRHAEVTEVVREAIASMT